jgi:hypothetical protein
MAPKKKQKTDDFDDIDRILLQAQLEDVTESRKVAEKRSVHAQKELQKQTADLALERGQNRHNFGVAVKALADVELERGQNRHNFGLAVKALADVEQLKKQLADAEHAKSVAQQHAAKEKVRADAAVKASEEDHATELRATIAMVNAVRPRESRAQKALRRQQERATEGKAYKTKGGVLVVPTPESTSSSASGRTDLRVQMEHDQV